MKNSLYWSSIECKYGIEHKEYTRLLGGFVYVFFYTYDVHTFLETVKHEFKNQSLEIIKMEFINEYDSETNWENAKDERKYNQIAKEAKRRGVPIFDDFYAYKQ